MHVVAFYPNQIKSATDNIGTFDKNNDDIRYSLKETQKDAQITVASDGALQIDPESDIIYSLKYQNLGAEKEDKIAQAIYEATGYPKEKTLQFIKDIDVMIDEKSKEILTV